MKSRSKSYFQYIQSAVNIVVSLANVIDIKTLLQTDCYYD